jgi:two-component system, LytTR family, sensor histidine kinase AlgZ
MQRTTLAGYAVLGLSGAATAICAALLMRTGATFGAAIGASIVPSLLLGAIGLASRFLCRAMPLRTTPLSRIFVAQAGSTVAVTGLWVVTWRAWLGFIGMPADTSIIFGVAAVLYAATVVVHYLVIEIDNAREAEEAALRYQVLAREAELKAFKAQVDPHFLYNSLNAVASLCGSQPQEARRMAQLLADFFRLMLRLGSRERITLAEEMELVSRYLDIEKVRFGDRLGLTIAIDDEARGVLVPPLLLQPLAENAVRHGIASLLEGGTIDVRAHVTDGMLRIAIENPTDPDRPPSSGEGIGLQNARGRVPGVLRAIEADGRFRVEMEIPR